MERGGIDLEARLWYPIIMNVLSLFDGISCGQLALRKAEITYECYFASEIKDTAIKVTQYQFPHTVQLGDIKDWKAWELPKIDLLLAGSPCQGFSFAGKRLNFEDNRSKLFFLFYDIMKSISPKWFLLENVNMAKKHQEVITQLLGIQPILIDSALFTAQTRKRLYWTNIPINLLPTACDRIFGDYLYRLPHGYITEQVKYYEKYPTLVAQSPGTKYKIITNEGLKTITPEYCEELQGLPIGHTSILPKTHRYNVIGDGWTIDVIAHILRGCSTI